MTQNPDYLPIDNGQLAYHHIPAHPDKADQPGILFCGGFKSDMTGSKAIYLQEFCQKQGLSFTRFDYQGHGQSSGDFLDGSIGQWSQDACAILDSITKGKQIIIGSSMGGWVMLNLSVLRPERCAALVGIAAAPDFTEDLMWAKFPADVRQTLEKTGQFAQPSEYSDDPYIITHHLITEGRNHLHLRDSIAFEGPIRLLHGMRDEDVPWQVSQKIVEQSVSKDVTLTLVKEGDHRLSEEADLARLGRVIADLLPQLG